MKSIVRTLVIVAAFAAPVLSHAQQSNPVAQPQQSDVQTSGYGGTASGKDQTGSQKGTGLLHRRGDSTRGDNCAGPISYCSIFFGGS
ncbi:hypothetical protein G3N95_24740 [Paraburkholderia sp. Tr-20389]|uniref:hypothetical protein n=1 Tax=Paraburkholderia sp. Tr-20389 TaxID=2703903 RepID=UPI00197E7870|nr:hypothetical protein [Paraburkholderia sp. Tr-20389]MBN3756170.1 hypothetical protein [Paraburkholderia sp. Tr-20389]